jgi:hypothetical protein
MASITADEPKFYNDRQKLPVDVSMVHKEYGECSVVMG